MAERQAEGIEPPHRGPAAFDQEVTDLSTQDQVLARVMADIGPCWLSPDEDPFEALVSTIVGQQLSKNAANAIRRRLGSLFSGDRPVPQQVLTISDQSFRAAGVSPQKTGHLRDLAQQVLSGELDLHGLQKYPDDEVVDRLSKVKGIGRWTAQMYLIFSLNRLDVFPGDDAAVLAAIRRLYGAAALETGQLEIIVERWRPYRSLAVWYLYQYLDRPSKDGHDAVRGGG